MPVVNASPLTSAGSPLFARTISRRGAGSVRAASTRLPSVYSRSILRRRASTEYAVHKLKALDALCIRASKAAWGFSVRRPAPLLIDHVESINHQCNLKETAWITSILVKRA